MEIAFYFLFKVLYCLTYLACTKTPTFLHSNTENEDISAVSEKPDIYCINHYDNAEAVRNMNGIHRLLTDGVKNMALKAEVL